MAPHGLAPAALALCVLAVAGCGATSTSLPYAVYADQIPIYPGAVLQDAMGSTSAGDTPESVSDGMAWFFEVKAPADKVIAFYERRLPEAKRDPAWEDGVRLVWVPRGAAPGEELSVVIGENELSIRESVKPGKRPGDPNRDSREMANELSGAVGGGSDDD
jgi:hypothetical protein